MPEVTAIFCTYLLLYLQIQGYPTIKLFHKGQTTAYTGECVFCAFPCCPKVWLPLHFLNVVPILHHLRLLGLHSIQAAATSSRSRSSSTRTRPSWLASKPSETGVITTSPLLFALCCIEHSSCCKSVEGVPHAHTSSLWIVQAAFNMIGSSFCLLPESHVSDTFIASRADNSHCSSGLSRLTMSTRTSYGF